MMTRIGGFWLLHRPHLHRRSVGAQHLALPSGLGLKKNVSCISRAGWPSGKLSAVKLYSLVSMSGPSAILKPMSEKIAVISSHTWLIGWMRPLWPGAGAHRQGDVDALGLEARVERRAA